MQYVGLKCVDCGKNIVFHSDAACCDGCGGIIHRECLLNTNGICPSCKKIWVDAVGRRIYLYKCLVCGKTNLVQMDYCIQCNAKLSWDSVDELHNARKTIYSNIKSGILKGIISTLASLLIITFVLLMFWNTEVMYPLGRNMLCLVLVGIISTALLIGAAGAAIYGFKEIYIGYNNMCNYNKSK
jgi:hypothetical protein